MSCPHCATADPMRGVEPLDMPADDARCSLCGRLLDAAAEQSDLRDADRIEPVGDVDSPLMPDFVSTEEELGENPVLTADDGPDETTNCHRCGVHVSALEGRGYCPKCGSMVGQPRRREPVDAPALLCLACGVPNPQGRSLCLACGDRL